MTTKNLSAPQKLSKIAIVISVALTLSACTALGPDYETPKIDEKLVSSTEFGEQITTKNNLLNNEAINADWWKSVFDNAEINRLVDKALQQNLSLRSAGLRVLQSQQQLAIATANQYPQQQSISGGSSRQKEQGQIFNNYNIGFNLSWEIDFWGRFERQIESAQATFEASVADYDSVMISLISQVVDNYILIRTYQNRISVAKHSIKLQEANFNIALAKFNSGESSELDVDQAQSLLNNTKANVPSLEIALQTYKNALALLLGERPQSYNYLLDEVQSIPASSASIALGMPQDILRRRPDIKAAERLLAAQSAQIGYAETELYPHLSIGGAIGSSAEKSGNLFNSDTQTWDVFGAFNWNIFNYGRLKSNVRLQDALFQELLVDYKNTVLQAQIDVENAIVSYLKSHEQVNFYQESADAAKRAVELSSFQYQNGLVDFNTVINTLVSYTEQQDLLVSTQGSVATNLVQVYLALGGGWEVRNNIDPVNLLPQATIDEMQGRTDYWNGVLNEN